MIRFCTRILTPRLPRAATMLAAAALLVGVRPLPAAETLAWPPLSLGSNWINWVSINPSAGAILTGTYKISTQADFAVYCIEPATGKIRWQDPLPGAWQGVYWTTVATAGKFGAAGGQIAQSGQKGFVRAYDMQTGARLLDDRVAGRVNTVTISGDGQWIACCYNGSGLRVYRQQTSAGQTNPTYTKTAEFSADENIQTMSMSDDGRWIASAEYGGRVRLWERLSDGTLRVVMYQPSGSPALPYWPVPTSDVAANLTASEISSHFLDMSADGAWIAGAFSNGHVYLLRRDTFQEVFGHPTAGYAAYGARVYSAAGGTEAYVLASSSAYNPKSGKYDVGQVQLLHEGGGDHEKVIWTGATVRPPNPGMGMDAQRKYVVLADGSPDLPDGGFYLFDTSVSPAPLWRHPTHQATWPMTISADGKTLVGGSDDGSIYCWKN